MLFELKTKYRNEVQTHLCESCSKAAGAAELCVSRTRWHPGERAAPQTWPTPGTSFCSRGCWELAPTHTSRDRSTGRKPLRRSPICTDRRTHAHVEKKTQAHKRAKSQTHAKAINTHTLTHTSSREAKINMHICILVPLLLVRILNYQVKMNE